MFFVGIGGTLSENSSSEAALRLCMSNFEAEGHETLVLAGPSLEMPMYNPKTDTRAPAAQKLIEAVRRADGVVLASPGYHGGMSGLVKNAIDYIEDTSGDLVPYLHGRPVGCIAAASGNQAAVATLASLRGVVHALRGWPTPYGGAINTRDWRNSKGVVQPSAVGALERIAHQVMQFSKTKNAAKNALDTLIGAD